MPRENEYFAVENPGRHRLNQVIKVKAISNGIKITIMCLLIGSAGKNVASLVMFLPKMHNRI